MRRKDVDPRLEPGLYRHHKGGLYEVEGVARHTEIEDQWLVIYRRLGQTTLYARPYEMFVEHIDREGQTVPRFEKVPEHIIDNLDK